MPMYWVSALLILAHNAQVLCCQFIHLNKVCNFFILVKKGLNLPDFDGGEDVSIINQHIIYKAFNEGSTIHGER